MNIHKDNIKNYIENFKKGLLNKTEADELFQYIEKNMEHLNPDELELSEILYYHFNFLNAISFDEKEKLYKPDEFKFVEYLEGLMGQEERKLFEQQIASDISLQKELALFQYTKLKPDLSVVYPNKDELKRKKIILFEFHYAAAGIFIAMLLFLLYFLKKEWKHPPHELISKKTHPEIRFQNSSLSPSLTPSLQKPLPSLTSAITFSSGSVTHRNKSNKKYRTSNPATTHKHLLVDDTADTIFISPVADNDIQVSIYPENNDERKDTLSHFNRTDPNNESVLITSLTQIENDDEPRSEISKPENLSLIQKVILFFRQNKLIFNYEKKIVVEHNDNTFLSLHIPEIRIIKPESVTFEDNNPSY
ncbi:MAG: hypothetical protein KatS3mg028_0790 [Bacteroidia bacterium]|nr:MAG: hypothetical protein KatS3mg028_0790 [Bacteroidia bacterium]